MAGKRYYWLKLQVGFFQELIIKQLQTLPEGDSIVLLYLKLLLKAINTEGIIYYQNILPSLDEEIALDTGEKPALVKLTISALCKYHAAVFLDDQEEKKPKEEGEPEIEEIPSYFADTVLNSMFLSYLEYRKENGKEVKGKAIGYCIDKLESLSNSPAEQVAIIKQTIQNGWTDFFPLKGKKEKVSGSNVSSWLEREKIQSTGGAFGD